MADIDGLLGEAMAAPQAQLADLTHVGLPPEGVRSARLRLIYDHALQQRLIEAGLGERMRTRDGSQPASVPVMRIFTEDEISERSAPNGSADRNGPVVSETVARLPSLEAMSRLVDRIQILERKIRADLAVTLDSEVNGLKHHVAQCSDSDLEVAYDRLGDALRRRNESYEQARRAAFSVIEKDGTFPERVYLTLLCR